jgi:release factor glutamine methyltransferase
MRNSKEVFEEIVRQLAPLQSPDETMVVARMLMRRFFALDHMDVMRPSWILPDDVEFDELKKAVHRLNTGEPIQYVLQEAHFCNHDFFVDHRVLIPRPETEEMVMMLLAMLKSKESSQNHLRIVDIGTGSGCIPISIALENEGASVMATDISAEALQVAQLNATKHNVDVHFIRHDILREPLPFEDLDIVVSNPPYIAAHEMTSMQRNVVGFEPHSALFVPDDDPLIFYRAIGREARRVLRHRGMVIAEVNQRFAGEVKKVWEGFGLGDVRVLKDLSDHERFVEGFQP